MRKTIARMFLWVACPSVLALVGWSCSPDRVTSGAPGQMYEPQELQRFVADSGPAEDWRSQEYIIGAGDELDIVFLYHSNLTTRSVPVRRDGRISLPYIGDAMAAGLTPMALDSVLTVRFAEILREPSLSVILMKEATQQVYVLGQVTDPGGYPFKQKITLLQAIAEARGFKEGAKPGQIVLIRREGVNKIVGIEIDAKAIFSGLAIQNDILLRNYDIVYVPKSQLFTVSDFAQEVHKILNVPFDLAFKGWAIRTSQANYEFFKY